MHQFHILANNFSIMKSPKPYSVGRIVMYVPCDTDKKETGGNYTNLLPAMIVRAWEELPFYQEHSQVNIKAFSDGPSDLWRCSVPYDENKTPGTWHWPEIK